MSNPIIELANIRRKQAKLKPTRPYVDIAPFTVPILQAMFEGRPFSWLPSPAPSQPLTKKQARKREALLRKRLDEADQMAKRMETQDPGSAAAFQAEVERKRRAVLSSLEREAKAREAA
jgi:hypothetical protein